MLASTRRVFAQFRTGFLGKASPVHFFWGSFDLAVTRFSGRSAPLLTASSTPGLPLAVAREAYSHEVSSAGFWPGGGPIDNPAYYSYAYPEPQGFAAVKVRPAAAFYFGDYGQFGLININMGQSSEPKVEEEVLSDVATYGKQLGRIGDALIVLLAHFHPRKPLTADETKAIDALKDMLDKIADVKVKHHRPAIRPGAIAAVS